MQRFGALSYAYKHISRNAWYYIFMARIKKVNLQVPGWSRYLYVVMALVLLPWTIHLGISLPEHHLSAHWDASWVGLNVGLIVSFTLTGIFAVLRSPWIVLSSTTVASLLLVDAWFDILSERQAAAFYQSVLAAVIFEIPLALMSYYLAYRVLRNEVKR